MPSPANVRAMQQAVAHHHAGRLAQAEEIYRRVLQEEPNNYDALQLLGLLAHQAGNNQAAVQLITRAIAIKPQAEFFINLSQAYRALGRVKDSADACARALQLGPNIPEAHNNMGSALKELGRYPDAIAEYQRAIQLRPSYAAAHNNLGNTFSDLGRYKEAETALRTAIRLDPNHAEAYNNLGHLFGLDQRYDEAVEACRRAIELKPALGASYNNLGIALHHQGKFEEGDRAFRRGLELDPKNPRLAANLLAGMSYTTRHSPAETYEAHAQWGRQFDALTASMPPHVIDRTPGRKLRIGFVSPDFRRHSVAFFVEPIFEAHDREHFEFTAYSDVVAPDEVTARLRALCERWRDIKGVADDDVAVLIRRDQIDILVDLAGHTAGARLRIFAYKPAPVQMTYLGYPATTGLRAIDYRITDSIADPPGKTEKYYTEKLLRLDPPFVCFKPPGESPAVVDAPAIRNGYITFGSFNKAAKAGAEMISLWAKLLHAVPNAKLMMKAWGLGGQGSRARLAEAFAAQGIGIDRLEMLDSIPSAFGHLEQYGKVDIGLDTYPYAGTTTTCEALWMGVPVVTLAGESHVSRVGATLLHSVGLGDLVADSEEAYVHKVQALAEDLGSFSQLRRNLRQRVANSPLTDARGFTSKLENAFRRTWLVETESQSNTLS